MGTATASTSEDQQQPPDARDGEARAPEGASFFPFQVIGNPKFLSPVPHSRTWSSVAANRVHDAE